MSEADDLVRERSEEARSGFERRVAATMAILAVLLAVDTLFAHRAHTEEILDQAKASDQWAYYQAKAIRRTTNEVSAQLAQSLSTGGPAIGKAVDGFTKTAQRYEHEAADIQKQAEELEHERDREASEANRFDLAEILFEVGLVGCSIAILTKRPMYWLASLAAAAAGAVAAMSVIPRL
jgi:ABC-type nickel/cobalt efflux system permease component RcnA